MLSTTPGLALGESLTKAAYFYSYEHAVETETQRDTYRIVHFKAGPEIWMATLQRPLMCTILFGEQVIQLWSIKI